MQSSPQHIFQFYVSELRTERSIAGNQRLVLRGKYMPTYMENLLDKYIMSYGTCEM